MRFPAVATVKLVVGTLPSWRRHIPTALLIAALAVLALALSGPRTTVSTPIGSASIVLVTDHSGSMEATDVLPSRLDAAQRAAHTFVAQLPSAARVGVVGFSTQPDTVQAPVTDRAPVLSAIDSQSASGGTDTGDALALAMDLLRQGAAHGPSAIVLLSDGAANLGRDPIAVAGTAGQQRIPIYTVALGSQDTTIPDPTGFGAPIPVPPDPALLQRIADASHARAFTAQDQGRLNGIYKQLGGQLGSVRHTHEVTASFALAALALLIGAAVAALRWSSGRIP